MSSGTDDLGVNEVSKTEELALCERVEVAEEETNPYDMVIVLYGDEMTVGAFVLNPEV